MIRLELTESRTGPTGSESLYRVTSGALPPLLILVSTAEAPATGRQTAAFRTDRLGRIRRWHPIELWIGGLDSEEAARRAARRTWENG